MRPVAGVVAAALEAIETREVRRARIGEAAGRHDQVARRNTLAAVEGHAPAVILEVGGHDARVEFDMRPQREAVRDMARIVQDLGLAGVALAPVPFLLELARERVGILHALDVAARTRIAVPVPGPADVAALLEHARRKAERAQPMQHVEAGETRADHDGIVLRVDPPWLDWRHDRSGV